MERFARKAAVEFTLISYDSAFVTFLETHLEGRLGEFYIKVNMPCVYRKEYFPPALSSHRRVRLNMSYRIQNTEY